MWGNKTVDDLPCHVPAPLANHRGLAGCDHGVWVGETWELVSSVSAGFLIQAQNIAKVLGIAFSPCISLGSDT